MGIMDFDRENKLERAKKQVAELKGFYVHLVVYLAVNVFITTAKIIGDKNNGDTMLEAFWDFGTFAVWLFWGVGLLFHGLNVFSYNPFFNKEWEERQIQRYMEKEKQESKKYR
ncbi:2TM domain-containing protein [Arenibacter sp. ARW7G5Y1]|uniref:2TM domain-containing protein n=1 Tax=Arenibacter sp. ARW7G5Y1 TaxID=2135619 RepID=UPI0021AD300C|nr:2TM domain-containing protein [Arenibacter sp. ARW7G5Y1]